MTDTQIRRRALGMIVMSATFAMICLVGAALLSSVGRGYFAAVWLVFGCANAVMCWLNMRVYRGMSPSQ